MFILGVSLFAEVAHMNIGQNISIQFMDSVPSININQQKVNDNSARSPGDFIRTKKINFKPNAILIKRNVGSELITTTTQYVYH